jgi:hypothetical protein
MNTRYFIQYFIYFIYEQHEVKARKNVPTVTNSEARGRFDKKITRQRQVITR